MKKGRARVVEVETRGQSGKKETTKTGRAPADDETKRARDERMGTRD